ncbi:MAG: hypothetical protein Ct9H300mP30_3790 [Methanobacteriota archaeon]|nr:MAG: hypothetical protein Ct9H300mP30_3790 [Euryarchaeota archaeon]
MWQHLRLEVASGFAAASFMLTRIMHEAGLPDGVINLIHGKGSGAGQHLVDAVDEGLVNKSASPVDPVGKMMAKSAAQPSLVLV